MMKYKSIDRDILILSALTIIAVALAFVLPPDWVPGRILTLPLVLVLPGYALTSALFSRQALEVPKRLVFSLGLSLAIVVLGGPLLNLTPFGLRAGSWAVLLGGITLAACVVTFIRRRRQGIPVAGWPEVWNAGFTFRQGLLLGLAVLIVCGAFAVSIIGAQRQPSPGFTQLWILPASAANAQHAVSLGVSNMESTTMEYRLAVNVNGKVVKEWPSIDLNPNEQWDATLVIPQSRQAGAVRVEADLYRANAPTTIYRHVVLWLGT
jgi:uncharacterized membrane protein